MRRAVRHTSREAWLAGRRCGSSTVAAILGISRYRSALDVYLELVEGYRPPQVEVQTRGQRWEPVVLHLYGQQTGRIPLAPTAHTTWLGPEDWTSATPDAFADDDLGLGRGLVEAKTDLHHELWGEPTTIEAWDDSYADVVRVDYAVQAYWQLYVLDAPWVDLAVLLPRYELRVYRLLRDLDYEQDLVSTVAEWWTRHIVGRTPPPLDNSRTFRNWLGGIGSTGQTLPASPVMVQVAAEHSEIHRTIKMLEQRRDALGNVLLSAIGDNDAIELPDGRTVRCERRSGRVTVDRKAILAERPDLYDIVERNTNYGEPYAYPKTYPARRKSA